MVRYLKYLVSVFVLLSSIGCSSIPTMYKVGKVATPIIVKDEGKRNTLKNIDEVVTDIDSVINAPK